MTVLHIGLYRLTPPSPPSPPLASLRLPFLQLFSRPSSRNVSLKFLTSYLLGANIQTDNHDSIEDARAAMHCFHYYLRIRAAGLVDDVVADIYRQGRRQNWSVPVNSTLSDFLAGTGAVTAFAGCASAFARQPHSNRAAAFPGARWVHSQLSLPVPPPLFTPSWFLYLPAPRSQRWHDPSRPSGRDHRPSGRPPDPRVATCWRPG